MLPACVLAVVAGYADAVVFLRLGLFAGLMTGNTVLMGIALFSGLPWRALGHLLVILSFFVGVMGSRVARRLGLRPAVPLVYTVLMLVVAGFAADSWAGPLLASGMGAQNAAMNRFGGINLNTVYLTGNMQHLSENFVAFVWHGNEAPPAVAALAIPAAVWVCYGSGALCGAAGHAYLSWPLLVPAALLAVSLLVRVFSVPAKAAG
jgi:uncharacterized membrane protein YoaK (UPF0700 family)